MLLIQDDTPFNPEPDLIAFQDLCRASHVYQGHGWGIAYMDNRGEWRHYRSIIPIWKADMGRIPPTRWLLAHARSAFNNEGIRVENNMPFFQNERNFIFNGEIRGVRFRAPGRIGAEKLFNVINHFCGDDLHTNLERAVHAVTSRSRHVRAMNMMLTENDRTIVFSYFTQEADYFTLYKRKTGNRTTICSGRFGLIEDWSSLDNPCLEMVS